MPDLHISKSNVSSPQMSPALDTVDTEQDPMMVSPPWLTAKPATSPTSKLKKLRLKVELETNHREVGSFTIKDKALTDLLRHYELCICDPILLLLTVS